MNLYADTSALLKLILIEPGSATMLAARDTAERLTSVELAYVEMRAGLAMAVRTRRVRAGDHPALKRDLETLWSRVLPVPLELSLLLRAADNAEQFALRSYDAIHLAALQAAGPPATLAFACWDGELRQAAGRLGYHLLPEQA